MGDRAAGQLLVEQGKLTQNEFLDLMKNYMGQVSLNDIPPEFLKK